MISPKKTVEGSVCGILGSLIFSMLFGWFFMDRSLLWACGVIGILGGITSQFGDLTASIFKRKMGLMLRQSHTGTRRDHGPVRQRSLHRAYRLLLPFLPFGIREIGILRMQNDLQNAEYGFRRQSAPNEN